MATLHILTTLGQDGEFDTHVFGQVEKVETFIVENFLCGEEEGDGTYTDCLDEIANRVTFAVRNAGEIVTIPCVEIEILYKTITAY